MSEVKLDNKDIEVLNVNKELINAEKPNGFKIQKNNLLMILKKVPKNIYRLVVVFLAAIGDAVPGFVSKIPLLGYGVDAIKAYGENFLAQMASDEFFDSFICPMVGITPDFDNNIYTRAYTEFTHHKGQYFQLSMTIKTITTFVVEHPALILAGGAALLGLAYKVGSAIIKKISRKIKFNELNDKQKKIYEILKEILRKARKIKKVENGDILVKDLNITYEITDHLRDYPDMLDKIYEILLKLDNSITKKNQNEYEKCRIELETCVFDFDKTHGNILNEQMHLVEDTQKSK